MSNPKLLVLSHLKWQQKHGVRMSNKRSTSQIGNKQNIFYNNDQPVRLYSMYLAEVCGPQTISIIFIGLSKDPGRVPKTIMINFPSKA